MSVRKSLVELSFTIKHNFIKSSTMDSFSATMCEVRIMVPGLHYSDAVTDTTVVAPAPALATVANSSATPVTTPNGAEAGATITAATASTPNVAEAGVTITPLTAPATAPNGTEAGTTVTAASANVANSTSTTVTAGVVATPPSILPPTSAPATAVSDGVNTTITLGTPKGTLRKTSETGKSKSDAPRSRSHLLNVLTVLLKDEDTLAGSKSTSNGKFSPRPAVMVRMRLISP